MLGPVSDHLFTNVALYPSFKIVFMILTVSELQCIKYFIYICDRPQEKRPSSHLVIIVEIPVLKFLISVTSFCLLLGRLYLAELDLVSIV